MKEQPMSGRSIVMGLVVAVLAMGASQARAELLAYEPFDYNDGALLGKNGGFGFAGVWDNGTDLSTDGQSIAFPGNPNVVAGNRISSVNTGNGARRQLSDTLTMAGNNTYYVSFLMKKQAGQFIVVKLTNGATTGGDGSGRAWFAGINGGNDHFAYGSSQGTDRDEGLSAGEEIMVVSKLQSDPGNNRWIHHYNVYTSGDTVPLAEPGSFEFDFGVGEGASAHTINHLQIYGSGGGEIDEIAIGTTYASVTQLPEPTTCLLMAAGAGLMLIRRR